MLMLLSPILLVVAILLLATVIFGVLVEPYLRHLSMTKSDGYPIGKATYEDFKTRFQLIQNWEYKESFQNSLFCWDQDKKVPPHGCGHYKEGYIHASQIIFNENAMQLGMIDYFRARLLIGKTTKKMRAALITPRAKKWSEIEGEEIMNTITGDE